MTAADAKREIDPTENVLQLVEAAVKRLDDLQKSELRRIDEQLTMHAMFSSQLASAETKRIDAIRAVDVGAVAVASERAAAQAVVLANQVVTSAEILRSLVASTAAAMATQLQALQTQLTDRISLLEKSQYQLSGSRGGTRDTWGWIIGAIMAIIALASFVVPRLK